MSRTATPGIARQATATSTRCPCGGVVIHLIADVDKVDRAILRKAAEAAHRPDAAELAALLPTTDGADV